MLWMRAGRGSNMFTIFYDHDPTAKDLAQLLATIKLAHDWAVEDEAKAGTAIRAPEKKETT